MEFIWIAVLVFAGLIESLTVSLVAVWFMPGALIGMILAFCQVKVWVQIAAFAVVSAAGLVLAKTVLKKFFKGGNNSKTNIDAIVGEKGIVTEKVENLAGRGEVKVGGLHWAARSLDESEVLQEGDVVTVVAVEGVKLICKKADKK